MSLSATATQRKNLLRVEQLYGTRNETFIREFVTNSGLFWIFDLFRVHTGEVIEGMIGSEHTRQYGIIGDSVNTAARLQSAAKRGEIVLSATTYDLLSEKPKVDQEQSITVKGKSAPLCIYILTSKPQGTIIEKSS